MGVYDPPATLDLSQVFGSQTCNCARCLGKGVPNPLGCACSCHEYANHKLGTPHMWYGNRTLCCMYAYVSFGDRHKFKEQWWMPDDDGYPPDKEAFE